MTRKCFESMIIINKGNIIIMYGYVYITTNKINNKKYIGQHKSTTFDKKYIGSGILLQKAIEHYGKENFEVVILKECFSEDELNQAEIELIKTFDAVNSEQFYNIARGGEGHSCTPWNKGKQGPPANAAQLEGLRKGWQQPASDRQKQQLSKRRKNCEVSQATRVLLSKNALGKIGINNGNVNKYVRSEELNDFLSRGWQRGHLAASPDRIKNFRKTYANKSNEQKQATRQKLHEALAGRLWVTNGEISKQIRPDVLQKFLNEGFVRGRKIK